MRIQLNEGTRLRHPVTRQLVGSEPFEVSNNDLFWARRLRDGDVRTLAPPIAAGAAPVVDKAPQPSMSSVEPGAASAAKA
jgi:hypothetical protein